ncbi:hypothetical protein GN156_02865 [bacterium LRH843]|nr:hypothetical protein [bacterium LRH843]
MALKKALIATVLGSAAGAATVLLKDNETRARASKAAHNIYTKIKLRILNQENRKLRVAQSHPFDYEN